MTDDPKEPSPSTDAPADASGAPTSSAATDPATSDAKTGTNDEQPKGEGFVFTDDGCRTEVRVGVLLILAAVFLWAWLGPSTSVKLYAIGLPLLLIGVPIQAMQARNENRPGFPWKVGIVLFLMALLMWPAARYRTSVDDSIHVQWVVILLLIAGGYILAWWPVAMTRAKPAPVSTVNLSASGDGHG